jgi:protein-disulfide isomerase
MKRYSLLFSVMASVVLLLCSSLSFATSDKSFTPTQKKAIEKIIGDYIVNNPEILVKASRALQEREQQKMAERARQGINKNQAALFHSNSPTVGAKSGTAKATMVEFFDYQCGHCKDMASVVNGLLKKNKDLKVIYKEFPIFGMNSEYAAKVALALNYQGKYKAFHNELFKVRSRLNKGIIDKVAKKVGANMKQLKADLKKPAIDKELKANYKLASALGIVGTPSFVIANNPRQSKPGDKVDGKEALKSFFVPGAANAKALQTMIDQAKE